MTRKFPDLNENLEWNLVRRDTLEARQGTLRRFIPPLQTPIDSYVCAIGLKNPLAPNHWRLGGYASQRVFVLPSSTTDFAPLMQAERKTLELNIFNLFVVPKIATPWLLWVDFPYWHERMFVEVWRYDGRDIDELTRLDEIELRLNQL